MMIDVQILDGPLDPRTLERVGIDAGAVGARVMFEGIVREVEDGRPLVALDYSAYEPMAHNQLKDLAAEIGHAHGLGGVTVRHSRGRVRVGEVSFLLVALAPHRKEALRAMDEFIDRMKRDVPIWKTAVFADGGNA